MSTPGRKGVLRVERALSPRTRGRGLIGGRVGYRRGNEKPSNLNGYGELWRKVFGPSGPVAFSCSEATRTSSWASSLRKVFTTCGGFNLSLFASLEGEPSGLLSAEGKGFELYEFPRVKQGLSRVITTESATRQTTFELEHFERETAERNKSRPLRG